MTQRPEDRRDRHRLLAAALNLLAAIIHWLVRRGDGWPL